MNEVMTQQEQSALMDTANLVMDYVRDLKITDNKSYEHAGIVLKRIKARRSEVMAKPLEKKQAAHGVWKFLSEICNAVDKPFDQAERAVEMLMIDYRADIERKRQAEFAKAQEKARIEAEEKRKAEIARMKEIGDKEAAKNLKAAPLEIKAVAPKTQEAPKIAGVSVRKIWDFQFDIEKLDPRYLIADTVAIRKVVNALGAKHGISGVTAFQKEVQ